MNTKVKALIAYILVLSVYTGYLLLDTFAISRVYGDAEGTTTSTGASITASTEQEIEVDEEAPANASSTDSSYTDDNISINIESYRENETTIYVADVKLSSSEYLKTALAQGLYGKNVKAETSEIAADAGAILAINGDYYGAREKGYVIKNGVLYRSEAASGREDLVIYEDGSFEIIKEDEVSAEELLANGAFNVLSFGPALVEEGGVTVGVNEEVGQAMSSNPRTAIGIIDENHYVFVVSDGRTDESAGLSLYELAEFMQGLGCKTAYNLDGGGSSTMYFDGEIVNNPTGGRAGHGSGSERSVSDIVYIGYGSGAGQEAEL